MLQELLWNGLYHDNGSFDSLKVPFRAVATDIAHARTVSLASGNLIDAVRASATLPLRYTPVRIDTLILVDGGLMANIPIQQLTSSQPDIVIG